MKAAIIEDETIAATRLKSILEEVSPGIEILAVLKSVKDSVKWLQNNKADILFMDIQLSDGISFEIFEQVPVITPVIFTTAYDQYTIRAFKVNSIDYLLKPIRKQDLHNSLEKYKSVKDSFCPDFEQLFSLLQGREPGYKKRFLIQYGEKIKKIEIDDVAYFFALEKNVFMKTRQDQSFPVDFTLDKLELIINPELFFRINRKFIVNMNSIVNMTAWSRSRIKLGLNPPASGSDETVVSVERSSEFKKWMNS